MFVKRWLHQGPNQIRCMVLPCFLMSPFRGTTNHSVTFTNFRLSCKLYFFSKCYEIITIFWWFLRCYSVSSRNFNEYSFSPVWSPLGGSTLFGALYSFAFKEPTKWLSVGNGGSSWVSYCISHVIVPSLLLPKNIQLKPHDLALLIMLLLGCQDTHELSWP